jgi:hypothetical protein
LIYYLDYKLENQRLESQQKQDIFIFFKMSRLPLGVSQPPIQGVLGLLPEAQVAGT